MSRTQTSENRLAQMSAPTAGRPKYASLTAGLLARKGEAVPATPYFAAEALDLFADRPAHAPRLTETAEKTMRAPPVQAEDETEIREAPRHRTARGVPPAQRDETGWRLRRLGLDVRASGARHKDEPAEAASRRSSEPGGRAQDARAADGLLEVHAPPAESPAGLADVCAGAEAPSAAANRLSEAQAAHPEQDNEQTVRFGAELPATLFARLALAANRSRVPTDDLMRQALEAYFEAAGIPRARLIDTH